MPINKKQLLQRQQAEAIVARLEETLPQIHDFISREVAVELLVSRVPENDPYPSFTRKKVNQRIDVALKNGELKLVDGHFVFGAFINWTWTKEQWKLSLADLPALNQVRVNTHQPAQNVRAIGYVLPATKEECHQALQEAYARIAQLEETALRQQATRP
ncbi:hypothetical protein ABC383_07260 [Noviherbaspirillum sp. 1P10PC]|uniref:hypothetical protein n=1 Tax=Noviherbaspirillum sp. 1P10PC TaxID=3132292 RepID=UPI00399F9F35